MADDDQGAARMRITGAVPPECAAVLVYTTFPDRASALSAGRQLVEQRVAGCINILPQMLSVYVWEGQLEEGHECVLLAKTMPERAHDCMEAILRLHPYATPAVLAVPVSAGATGYVDWLRAGATPRVP